MKGMTAEWLAKAEAFPQLTLLAGDAQLLNDYAVRYRYPGIDATKKQAQLAVKAAGRVRHVVLPLLKKR